MAWWLSFTLWPTLWGCAAHDCGNPLGPLQGHPGRWEVGPTTGSSACLFLAAPTGDAQLIHRDARGRMVFTRCVEGQWVSAVFEDEPADLLGCVADADGQFAAFPQVLSQVDSSIVLDHDHGRGTLEARILAADGGRSPTWVVARFDGTSAPGVQAVVDAGGGVHVAVVERGVLSLWAPVRGAGCGEPHERLP